MPGRVMMDHDGATTNGLGDLKKDRSQAQEATMSSEAATTAQPVQQPNGIVGHDANGGMPNGVPSGIPHGTDGASDPNDTAVADYSKPPQLDQSWRQSDAFPALGKMFERQSQYCYQNLSTTLTAMSEVPTDSQGQQPNGVVSHSGLDTSKASQQKKRLMLEFAKDQREFFVKSLVLVDWCRHAEDIYKLKDVNEWQRKQQAAQTAAADAFLRMKGNMLPAKMPNPNIEGAMELLSTSKASWIPDLGYLPTKRLSAKQLLETLRDMNVILATRLVLHEDLPEQMREYTIVDGRATFTVENEFEVDLSVADEDPSTPFYFIDIRLLYQPSSSVLDNRFRAEAEGRVNHRLATGGLAGAFDFLHNYVLTHKINVLRSQAADMVAGRWFDCIRAELVHRILVVQYWKGLPGKKSWLEFGIYSGKDKSSSGQQHASPAQIGVRWFRQGVHVADVKLDFDWKKIDLERCVMEVIERHTSWLLETLQTDLRSLIAAQEHSRCELNLTDSNGGERVLSLTMPSSRSSLAVRVEPVTGDLVISPPSRATKDAAQRLNKDASADRARWLASLVCAAAQERVHKEAQLLGWSAVPGLVRQDNWAALFKGKTRHSLFKPSPAWGSHWVLAVTFSLGGEDWWVCQLAEKRGENGNVAGKIVSSARIVSLGGEDVAHQTISKSTLLRVDRRAVAEVAFAALSVEFNAMEVPHQVQTVEFVGMDAQAQRQSPSSAMLVAFSPLMKESGSKSRRPWANEAVRLTHHGLTDDDETPQQGPATVRHDLRLTLTPGKMQHLQKHLGSTSNGDIAMNSTGGLALKLLTPFGEPFARRIQARLHNLEHLDRYLGSLKHQRLQCVHVSLARLSFVYSASPRLVAELVFNKDGSGPAQLKLEPSGSNPHQRTRVMLEQGFNQAGERGFSSVLRMLSMTLPLLRAFDRIEATAASNNKQSFAVYARSPAWFMLKYRDPLPALVFQVRLKVKRQGDQSKVMWLVQRSRQPAPASDAQQQQPPEEVLKALDTIWQGKEEHWSGLGNGAIADAVGVAQVVAKIDSTLRLFEGLVARDSAAAPSQPAAAPPVPQTADSEAPKQQQKQPAQKGPQGQASKTQMQRQGSKQGGSAANKQEQRNVITLD